MKWDEVRKYPWYTHRLMHRNRRSYRRDVVRKATLGQRGLGALMSWGPEKMLIRCSKESHHPTERVSGPLVEHQENKKDTTVTAITMGSKYCSLCSVSSALSHANLV